MEHITIIGGGISGLTLAWLFAKQSPSLKITLCETTNRLGGWIQTETASGFLFEQGPHILRARGSGRYSLDLVESLGLADQMISPPTGSRKRFLYTKGCLKEVPENLSSFLRWSPLLLKGVWNDLKAPKREGGEDEESVADFVSRRWGPEILEQLVDPFINGIYAGDPKLLSMCACFPKLVQWETEHGSLTKGLWSCPKNQKEEGLPTSTLIERWQTTPLWSLKGGLGVLVKTLEAKLLEAGVEIKLSCPVVQLIPNERGVLVKALGNKEWQTDKVYAAMSPNQTADLCQTPFKKQAAASVATVSLGYRQALLPYEGFGHLVPSNEKEDILGVIWDSALFPQQNRNKRETRLTVMLGGIRRPELVLRSDHELEGLARHAVARQLGIKTSPDYVSVKIAKESIPQPDLGSARRLEDFKKRLPQNVVALGSGWKGVSVNDCVAEAYRFVTTHLALAQQFPLENKNLLAVERHQAYFAPYP